MGTIIILAGMFVLLFLGWKPFQLLIAMGSLIKIRRALYIIENKDREDFMSKLNIKNKDVYSELVADSLREIEQARRDGGISLEKEVSRDEDVREL